MKKKLLITDLDNTLYDWVRFFSLSFDSMLNEIVSVTKLERELLIDEFKKVHQYHYNIEHPFAVAELPSIIKYFGSDDKAEILNKLDSCLHAFNSMRKKTLVCYPGVIETLNTLSKNNIKIVAHTEAPVRNALYRLERLDLKHFFSHIYAPRDKRGDELDSASVEWIDSNKSFLTLLDNNQRKPNPSLLIEICEREGVTPAEAVYIGDSIVKDVAMSNSAGITSVWAEYGKQHAKEYWDLLVSITHWSHEDVKREEGLKAALGQTKPDVTALSFPDILDLFSLR